MYFRPADLHDALVALRGGDITVLAGGTDYYPSRLNSPPDQNLLDITAIEGLRGVAEAEDHWRLGAATTWSDIATAPLPSWFDGLKLAAREVGGPQIQNAGTIGGNLCNASPAADGVPALLSLDAEVELAEAADDGAGPIQRTLVPLSAFVQGNRRTALRPGQLLTALRVPKAAANAISDFRKLGARRYLVISLVSVAAVLEPDGAGRVARARIAVGACGPVPRRLDALEADLAGAPVDRLAERLTPAHLAPLSPIDDVRASAAYRLDAAFTLVGRTLRDLGAWL